jgi:uncharacterized protein (DUF924 family)
MDVVARVLAFWLGEKGSPEFGTYREIWFRSTPAFDALLRARFLGDHRDARAGRLDRLAADAEGALALVLLLDQFPRNMFRGMPEAYASDAQARAVADAAIGLRHDMAVAPVHRRFFYLPFEHAESMADQERSVALFTALGDAESIAYAVRHRDIIARFGRFPHRNAILGRPSAPAEIAFLKEPGSSF